VAGTQRIGRTKARQRYSRGRYNTEERLKMEEIYLKAYYKLTQFLEHYAVQWTRPHSLDVTSLYINSIDHL